MNILIKGDIMKNLVNKEGFQIPENILFPVRVDSKWEKLTTGEIFKGKKVIVFSLPGAFTPTCSSTHLPRYEELYDTFKSEGIDEVYCLSVNDTFVMNEWAEAQEIEKVKLIPDGNTHFTDVMGMLVDKEDLGFGKRSWRYSILVDDGKVVKHFIEPDVEGDPFTVSDADTMLSFINKDAKKPDSITIFSKAKCPFCREAKELLTKQGKSFNEVCLPDANRQKVLAGLTGKIQNTAPQIFVNGELIGGLDKYKERFGDK